MNIQCPYNEIELKISLVSAVNKIEKFVETHGEENSEKILANMPITEIKNSDIAAYHEISVDTLVNSPNMNVLRETYREVVMGRALKYMRESFGLTDVEAWAIALARQLGFEG